MRDPDRRFLDQNTSSRNYLDHWDLTARVFFEDLADGLEAVDHLFLKDKTFPNQAQRYQSVLAYPEDEHFPALDIHVTFSPRGEPPNVKVAIHASDTLKTLPRIPVTLPTDETNQEAQ